MGICVKCGLREPKSQTLCAVCLKHIAIAYRYSSTRSAWLQRRRKEYARALVRYLEEGGERPEPPKAEDYQPALWNQHRMRAKPKRRKPKRKYTKQTSQAPYKRDTLVVVANGRYFSKVMPYRKVKPGMQIIGVVEDSATPRSG